MLQSAGTSRFAYNWKLGQLIEQYEKAKEEQNTNKPKLKLGSAIDWHKEWVLLKMNYHGLEKHLNVVDRKL